MDELRIEAHLGDAELLARLRQCLARDRCATAQLLVHLGEVDARRLYRDEGFSSMFEYCVRALHMSESEAGVRIRVARMGRAFPEALQKLARGELHLTALRLLAPVLTRDNLQLLAEARFKSKEEVLEILAQHFPQPDVPNVIRKLPARPAEAQPPAPALPFAAPAAVSVDAPAPASEQVPSQPSAAVRSPSADVAAPPSAPAASQPSAAVRSPLGQGRYKIQFTASQRWRDKLAQAEHLLRHQVPTGDVASILERALDLLIAERKKQRFAAVRRPRAASAASSATRRTQSSPRTQSRHIPNEVKRAVVARDGEQCSFVAPDGHRCSARGWLEFEHDHPYARGGSATTDNIRILCRAHNALMADRVYGRAFMVTRSTSKHVPEPTEQAARLSNET